jgi:DNA repair protein RecN (Recombination protein N)
MKKSDQKILADYKQSFLKCKAHTKALYTAAESYAAFATQQDYMQFRFADLEKFAPCADDYQALLLQSKQGQSLGKKQDFLAELEGLLRDHSKLEAKLGALVQKNRELEENTAWKEARVLCEQLARTVQEAGAANMATENQFDIEQTEQRLAAYQSYFRKFQVLDCEGLVDKYAELKKNLKALDGIQHVVRSISVDLQKDLKELAKHGSTLDKIRQKLGQKVIKWINNELHELAMPGAEVKVDWSSIVGAKTFCPPLPEQCDQEVIGLLGELLETFSGFGSDGTSRAEFLLKSNKGSDFKPLAKIASGGEASRIMLAFKKCMAIGAGACVLVFDEIDAGISGRAANSVGKKLAELANKFQIVCVSHLPQVAVYSDAHIYAHKSSDKTTQTHFEVLTEKGSISEVARLLSGEGADKTAIANAKSLRKKASTYLKGL